MFGFTEEDFTYAKPVIFKAKEIVKFTCTDVKEDDTKSAIHMTCKILSGEHAGREKKLTVKDGDSEFAKQQKVQFALTFWTKEELMSGNFKLARLVGKVFTAQAKPPREYNGNTYQDFGNYQAVKEEEAKEVVQESAPSPTDDF